MTDIKYFVKNPNIDFMFGYFGNQPILTKQDKFKPVQLTSITEDGKEEVLNNFYVKNPDSDSLERFKSQIAGVASEVMGTDDLIKAPNEVEVILSITMKERRFKEVDVDNLAKSVLDSLIGIVFEDDSQVSTLLVNKSVHPMKVDSIMIAITRLSSTRNGYVGFIDLFKEGREW